MRFRIPCVLSVLIKITGLTLSCLVTRPISATSSAPFTVAAALSQGSVRPAALQWPEAVRVQPLSMEIGEHPSNASSSTTILEFLSGIADSSADGNTVRLSPGLFQPIAADDVAPIVAEVALAAPRNGIVEIAGPERAP